MDYHSSEGGEWGIGSSRDVLLPTELSVRTALSSGSQMRVKASFTKAVLHCIMCGIHVFNITGWIFKDEERTFFWVGSSWGIIWGGGGEEEDGLGGGFVS